MTKIEIEYYETMIWAMRSLVNEMKTTNTLIEHTLLELNKTIKTIKEQSYE